MKSKRCQQCGIVKIESEYREYSNAKGRYSLCRDCETLNARYKRALKAGDTDTVEHLGKLYRGLEALGYRTPLTRKRATHTDSFPTTAAIDKIMKHHGLEVEDVVRQRPIERQVVKPTVVEATEVTLYDGDGEVAHIIEVPEVPKSSVAAAAQSTSDTADDVPITKVHEIDRPPTIPDELIYWLEVDMAEWHSQDMSPEFLQETVYESLKRAYRPQLGIDKERYIPIYDDTYKNVLNDILRRFDEYEESYLAVAEYKEDEVNNGSRTD